MLRRQGVIRMYGFIRRRLVIKVSCEIARIIGRIRPMPERLVDVFNSLGIALHTFPVQIEDPNATEEDYKARALELASHVQLVPQDDVETMTARMHVSRPGPATPIGDDLHVLFGTRQGLEKVVRERAYFIWQQDGSPTHGRAEEHWHRALEQHLRERAYFIWKRESCPEGQADEHWRRSVEWETY